MNTDVLMAISPLDGRYHEKLNPLRAVFSEYGLMRFRFIVEIRWLEMLADFAQLDDLAPLSSNAKKWLNELIMHFSIEDAKRIKQIESNTNHDVKAVEYYLKERFATFQELDKINEFVHFGCTSEDINNLAYGLMLQSARNEYLIPVLQQLITQLKQLAHEHADLAMLARTHGQPASPTTLGKEIANTIARLERQLEQFQHVDILAKLNGATGNYNALAISYPEINWQALNEHFVKTLGLKWNAYTTQIEPHDSMAEYFAILARINTILIDFNRDIWSYIAINYFQQKSVANEVGSSTMPHKINPIDFENAEGNLGLANALFAHFIEKLPISRWQRDLSDSTVLRNIGVAISHSFLAYQATSKGLTKLNPNIQRITDDLAQHTEVLGEAIQTVMRRFNIENPYEKLKEVTRGKTIDQEILQTFIDGLSLPLEVKKRLSSLTPKDYIGYAAQLAKKI